jgi:hypothetical protein
MLRLNSDFNPYFHPPLLDISPCTDEQWEIFLNVLRATAT